MSIASYSQMLSSFYNDGTTNHLNHNSNPHYWSLLMRRLISSPEHYTGKNFLDFGCGKGRNVSNARQLVSWRTADGVDISPSNIKACKEESDEGSEFFVNNGRDLSDLESNKYHFVLSTIVLQHICVHELRVELMKEIFRVMAKDTIFSFQMGFGDASYVGTSQVSGYYDNNFTASGTNGQYDVRVTNPSDLVQDLEKIGFKDVAYQVRDSWADSGHPQWIYVESRK